MIDMDMYEYKTIKTFGGRSAQRINREMKSNDWEMVSLVGWEKEVTLKFKRKRKWMQRFLTWLGEE